MPVAISKKHLFPSLSMPINHINKRLERWCAQQNANVMKHGSCSMHGSRGQPLLCFRVWTTWEPRRANEKVKQQKGRKIEARGGKADVKAPSSNLTESVPSPVTNSRPRRQRVSCPLGTDPYSIYTKRVNNQGSQSGNRLLGLAPAQAAHMSIPDINIGCFWIPLSSQVPLPSVAS